MNKKQIIQLVVILAAFGGAGFVLYEGGIFGSPSASTPAQQAIVASVSSQPILPYGETLDFKQAIDKTRFDYNLFEFTKLSPGDVGVDVNTLIVPVKKE